MKKIILSTVALIGALSLNAQDDAPKLSVSGTVDVYGTTNNVDGTGTPGLLIASPEKANGFGLGMANTVFSYDGAKSGVVADLAFGPRADDANMAGAINQLYAYYNVSESVTITAGQFNTFLGYEVISPAANFNYSVSYLFNAGPFSHTGIKLDYAATEDLSFLLAVTNAHAISSADANESGATQFGAQVGYKGQYLNFIYGAVTETSATDAVFVDYTGGFDLSESFYVGINAAYAYSDDEDSGYQGAALYLENTFSETFALGLRPEFFSLIDGDESEDLFALTLTGSTQLDDNLKLITELRYDNSDDYIIEGIAAEKNVTALTIAAVYSF
ncbi:porin [Flavobacteriaceae bacterium]|nr:porin [Flavobacteriaceae bacterium]MDA7724087.1 porin [Flavobacteriaceae bacterium]MDA7727540.1 porin [Flavobacteriaceae bacterium]MDA7849286.1 porin [Flavobacteriaceae bacterium]|tara:strand:- start:61119 stop:62111 length:993 start_codon:yes stop_codon:yes gene_type:complete